MGLQRGGASEAANGGAKVGGRMRLGEGEGGAAEIRGPGAGKKGADAYLTAASS